MACVSFQHCSVGHILIVDLKGRHTIFPTDPVPNGKASLDLWEGSMEIIGCWKPQHDAKRISNSKVAAQAFAMTSHSYMQEGSERKLRRPRTVLAGFLRMIFNRYLMIRLFV